MKFDESIPAIKKTEDKIKESFGETFCLAKWYHANIYLQLGETHSCYHPRPHKINKRPLLREPATLHNTKKKIKERKRMLKNLKPKGCQYCWNIEDLNQDLVSDRHIRNNSLFEEDRMKEVEANPLGNKINPAYVELSFSNLCNFKCGYCHPKASSRFYSEVDQQGPYLLTKGEKSHSVKGIEIFPEEDNPYIAAWWAWWPELKKSLKNLRVTGGEPLLQKSTFQLLDRLEQEGAEDLNLSLNSNMGIGQECLQEFVSRITKIYNGHKIKGFQLYTSVDSWGERAEYIRYGLDIKKFEENIKYFLRETDFDLSLMITFNLLSVSSFVELLKKILEWRSEFPRKQRKKHRIQFDVPYLKEPLFYDINILPKKEFLPYMEESLSFIKENCNDASDDQFTALEYQRFLRVLEYMKKTEYRNRDIELGRRNFAKFFDEHDKRRKTNFLETFPEMSGFYELCKNT